MVRPGVLGCVLVCLVVGGVFSVVLFEKKRKGAEGRYTPQRTMHVFSAELDIVMSSYAFTYIKKEPAITDSGAKDLISGIYGKYDLGYHFDLLNMLFCVVCLVLGAICFGEGASHVPLGTG